jgi:UDPglucose 6-dehydrogenase
VSTPEIRTDRIVVVGLGKLGLCLAACLAERGFEVLGVDVDPRVVEHVNRGASPLVEPGLDELIARWGGGRLRATLDHREAVEFSDVTVVLVSTPSEPDGSFSNCYVVDALTALARALRESSKPFHLFTVSSTVAPGSAGASFVPLLEHESGRRLGEGFGLCYVPDFVALGDVVNGFLRPDLVLIGESDPASGAIQEAVAARLCVNDAPVRRMSIASAEIAKVALNAYITVKISFANLLGLLCQGTPGADVDAVSAAVGLDRRIGTRYFTAGLSFGGTCFPRDTRAFAHLGRQLGTGAMLMDAVDSVNAAVEANLAERVTALWEDAGHPTVGIIGMSFKPDTPVLVESPGMKLADALLAKGARVLAYDALAGADAVAQLGGGATVAPDLSALLDGAGLVVLTQPLADAVEALNVDRPGRDVTVVDCWRALDPARVGAGVEVVPLYQL